MKNSTRFACVSSTLLLLAFAARPLFADAASASAIFVATNPLEAVVLVDGRPLDRLAPLIVRNLSAGKHTITVTKRGYAAQTKSILVTAGAAQAVRFDLQPQFIDPLFPTTTTLSMLGRTYPYAQQSYAVPTGSYEVTRSGNTVRLAPIFPGQSVLSMFDVLTPILIGAAAVTTVQAFYTYGSQSNPFDSAIPFYALSALSAAFDVTLHLEKLHYERTVAVSPISVAEAAAAEHFARGGELLAGGDIPDALEQYVAVVTNKSDSVLYAQSIYQLGRLHVITGNTMLAAAEFRIIIDKYPLPELYDRSCKSLADIYVQQGDFKRALETLGQMVFLDPLYPKSQIDEYRAQITAKINGAAS